ncbi:MAG: hypothetical protein WC130_12540 [Kiritimatiellia bacterium]|jgi:hypothetical protein
MALLLGIVGLFVLSVGIQNRQDEAAAELQRTFSGEGNFLYWILALGVIGAIGSIDAVRSTAKMFLLLLFTVFTLSNKGLFGKLQEAVAGIKFAPPNTVLNEGKAVEVTPTGPQGIAKGAGSGAGAAPADAAGGGGAIGGLPSGIASALPTMLQGGFTGLTLPGGFLQ